MRSGKVDRRVLDTLFGVLDTGRLTDLQQCTSDATRGVPVAIHHYLATRAVAGSVRELLRVGP